MGMQFYQLENKITQMFVTSLAFQVSIQSLSASRAVPAYSSVDTRVERRL